jgi:alkylation response protein AidB-like acyl-CoA dehydrogenase
MQTAVDESVLDEVHKIGPRMRELGEVGDRERRLPDEAIELLRNAGLFRLWTPRSFGGRELDPVSHARAQEEMSRYDSAAGWAMMVESAGAWWPSRLPDEGAEDLFAGGPDLLSAVAFYPPVEAHPVDGGFRISGRRAFASNSGPATWLWMTALVMDGAEPKMVGGNPIAMAVFFPAGEAQIHDTWHTLGMRGTDSNDISVEDVFVPERRTFVLDPNGPIG